jgi:hypothetical protein
LAGRWRPGGSGRGQEAAFKRRCSGTGRQRPGGDGRAAVIWAGRRRPGDGGRGLGGGVRGPVVGGRVSNEEAAAVCANEREEGNEE